MQRILFEKVALPLFRRSQRDGLGCLFFLLFCREGREKAKKRYHFTVLQAEQSLLPQQISLAEVKSRALNSVAQIYQALGGGWIDQALIEEQQAIREIEEAEKLKKQSPAANQAEPAPKPVDGEPVKLDTAKQQ